MEKVQKVNEVKNFGKAIEFGIKKSLGTFDKII